MRKAVLFSQLAFYLFVCALLLLLESLSQEQDSGLAALAASKASESRPALPGKVLWAWKRDENLEFIDPREFGVAYLACQIMLSGSRSSFCWRHEKLKLPENAALVPVFRIDTSQKCPPELNDKQLEELTEAISAAANFDRAAEIQIDFDAKLSERDFYRKLIRGVQKKLNGRLPLSITCLASWCMFDDWIKDLPVDERVPMIFSLGQERDKLIAYFENGGDFRVSACRSSLGISIDDQVLNRIMIPLAKRRKIAPRVFVFSKYAWKQSKVESVRDLLKGLESQSNQ